MNDGSGWRIFINRSMTESNKLQFESLTQWKICSQTILCESVEVNGHEYCTENIFCNLHGLGEVAKVMNQLAAGSYKHI